MFFPVYFSSLQTIEAKSKKKETSEVFAVFHEVAMW